VSRYFAELDPNNVVLRVVVCDNPDWLTERLGGVWVETADPYTEPGDVAYCGPGHGYDPNFPARFARPWMQPVATPDGWTSYDTGDVVFHQGRLWISTTGGNVWEPGVSGWHDQPTGGQPPLWVQPTGAHDAYLAGAIVRHKRPTGNPNVLVTWSNSHGDGNVWEPGVFGWTQT
jgi:hypothetical protein